jgi:DNA-binding CsgD family transcriptional regulator
MEIFRELDAWAEIARCQAGIGWIAVAAGDFDQASRAWPRTLRLNQDGGQRLGIARGLEACAALAAASGQPGQAARLAGAACQLRESLGLGHRHRPADRAGARVRPRPARHLGRAALFAEGREMTPETPSPSRSAPAQARPARRREPAWTDPSRAARPDRPACGAPAGRADPRPLTPREHEIARLIAKGLANQEIADELVISPATAARHVANILAKLGYTRARRSPHGPRRHDRR